MRRIRLNRQNTNRRRNNNNNNIDADASQPSEINVNDLPKYEEIVRAGGLSYSNSDNNVNLNAQTSYRTNAEDEQAVNIYINDSSLNDIQLPKYADLNLDKK